MPPKAGARSRSPTQMRIYVRPKIGGWRIFMSVLPTDTIFDVKEQIHQRMEDRDNGSGRWAGGSGTRLVTDLQHLLAIMGQFPARPRRVYLGMGHLTLSDYGIQHGDTVEVSWNDDEIESYYTSARAAPVADAHYICEGPRCRICGSDSRLESWTTMGTCPACFNSDCGGLCCLHSN